MRVLLIGDTTKDVFVLGRCDRISPERPVPVFVPISSGSNAGMAGNVAENLQSLSPSLEVVTLFPETTSTKIRYVDKGSNQHLLRVDTDVQVSPVSLQHFMQILEAQSPLDAVVLSDYGKGFLNQQNMKEIATICEARSIPTFLDTKGILGEWSDSISVVKINAKEYATQLSNGVKRPWVECRNLIVTKGSEGMVLFDPWGKESHRTKPNNAKVYDVVGAGDTTLAALVIGYLETGDLKQAMDFAAKASAIAVSKPGVVAVKREEI